MSYDSKFRFVKFINAESTSICNLQEGKETFRPALLLSFESEDDIVDDVVLSLQDARQIVSDIVNVLSGGGDPTAQKIKNLISSIDIED